MNLPNKLTISRFVLTGVFLLAIFTRVPGGESVALLLFVAASVTDFLDGRIARSRKLVTNFGVLMDPLADKILVCSAFIAFVELRQIQGIAYIAQQARAYDLGSAKEHAFELAPDAGPLPDDEIGRAHV